MGHDAGMISAMREVPAISGAETGGTTGISGGNRSHAELEAKPSTPHGGKAVLPSTSGWISNRTALPFVQVWKPR